MPKYTTFKNIISKFSNKKILVIGDVILDRYIQGNVSRISPEAPVPVVLEEKFFYMLGGAANVSHNLSCLGAKVSQLGRVGHDFEGNILKRELKRKKIDISPLFVDKRIPSVTKTRVIAQNQQIVRIDKEKDITVDDKALFQKISNFIQKEIKAFDAVIISDYGKGMITPDIVNFTRDIALKHKKIIIVDPKVEHFGYYRNVTSITPNKKEVENAIRNIKIKDDKGAKLNIKVDKLDSDKLIEQAGTQLLSYLDLDCLLITLGENGMRLFEKNKKPYVINTIAKEVFDVSGAGDTVISVFALALSAGATKRTAAELSNIAAGVVVGKIGTVPIFKDELLKAIK